MQFRTTNEHQSTRMELQLCTLGPRSSRLLFDESRSRCRGASQARFSFVFIRVHSWLNRTLLAASLAVAAIHPVLSAETNAGSAISLKLMTEGLGAPIGLVPIADGSGRLLVAEQAGLIQLIDRDGKKSEQPFLDLRGKIVP